MSFDVPDIGPYGLGVAGDDTESGPGWLEGVRLASWTQRFGAGVIDVAATIILPALVLQRGLGLGDRPTEWVMLACILASAVVLQGITGQTLGKRAFGLRLVYPAIVAGAGRHLLQVPALWCAWRLFLHSLDLVFFVGFLWPIGDDRRQTFADKIAKTVVIADMDIVIEEVIGTTESAL